MNDERTEVQQRRRRSRPEADQLAAEYERSGLSREAFCNHKGLSTKTLARYLTRYRKQQAVGNAPQRWVAVEVAASSSCGGELAVVLATGRRIEVKRGFDGGTLRQLVGALEVV